MASEANELALSLLFLQRFLSIYYFYHYINLEYYLLDSDMDHSNNEFHTIMDSDYVTKDAILLQFN